VCCWNRVGSIKFGEIINYKVVNVNNKVVNINIKVLMRRNEFGVYSIGLRWHLYKTGNFKQVLVRYVFKRLAASWCQEFECKNFFRGSLQLGKKRGLYGTLRN